MNISIKQPVVIVLLYGLLCSIVFATEVPTASLSPQLQKCLKRSDDLPDIASAEATVWVKKGGGNDAHLCRAFAQQNRGMHADAAREFWFLASYYDKYDMRRAILMHDLSGQEFLNAKDPKNADMQYSSALKLSSGDSASLIGRAKTRMTVDRYWDALDDLNRVLKVQPDNVEALRQRGRAWAQLGNDKNAQDDLAHADEAELLQAAKPAQH